MFEAKNSTHFKGCAHKKARENCKPTEDTQESSCSSRPQQQQQQQAITKTSSSSSQVDGALYEPNQSPRQNPRSLREHDEWCGEIPGIQQPRIDYFPCSVPQPFPAGQD